MNTDDEKSSIIGELIDEVYDMPGFSLYPFTMLECYDKLWDLSMPDGDISEYIPWFQASGLLCINDTHQVIWLDPDLRQALNSIDKDVLLSSCRNALYGSPKKNLKTQDVWKTMQTTLTNLDMRQQSIDPLMAILKTLPKQRTPHQVRKMLKDLFQAHHVSAQVGWSLAATARSCVAYNMPSPFPGNDAIIRAQTLASLLEPNTTHPQDDIEDCLTLLHAHLKGPIQTKALDVVAQACANNVLPKNLQSTYHTVEQSLRRALLKIRHFAKTLRPDQDLRSTLARDIGYEVERKIYTAHHLLILLSSGNDLLIQHKDHKPLTLEECSDAIGFDDEIPF